MPKPRPPRRRDLLRFRASSPSWQVLVGRHMSQGCPALAMEVLDRTLEGSVSPVDRVEAEALRAELEPVVAQRAIELGATWPEGLAALLVHERVVEAMGAADFDTAAELLRELLEQLPDCRPALNNLSLIAWVEERHEDAIELARRVVAAEPDNLHAVANLVTFLFRRGALEEAEAFADRLRRIEAADILSWYKKAEAFSYLGEDAAVVDAFAQATALAAETEDPAALPADLVHLAAVAEHRLGHLDAAEALWTALTRRSGLGVTARENLDDRRRPVAERNGPVPFGSEDWVGLSVVRDLGRVGRSGRSEKILSVVRSYFATNPGLERLVPAILNRGHPITRVIVFILIDDDRFGDIEAIAEAVRAFAGGRFGSDDERHKAMRLAMRKGWAPSGAHRMWVDGAWQERLMLGFEIHGEPTTTHNHQVSRWLMRAAAAQDKGKFEEAEKLLAQALEAEPDAPDVHYNVSALRHAEGRNEESLDLVRAVHARWPDYLFACCRLAEELTWSGDVAEARRLVDPLLLRPKFHYSEFGALTSAMIVISLAEGNLDAAESWLGMIEASQPDHPTTAQSRRRVEAARRELGGRR